MKKFCARSAVMLTLFLLGPSSWAEPLEPKITVANDEKIGTITIRTVFVDNVREPFAIAVAIIPLTSHSAELAFPTEPKSIGAFAADTNVVAAASIGWLRSYDPPPALSGMLAVNGNLSNSFKFGDPNLDVLACTDKLGGVKFYRNFAWLLPGEPDEVVLAWAEKMANSHQGCIQIGPALVWSEKIDGAESIKVIDNALHDDKIEGSKEFGRDLGFARNSYKRAFIGVDRRKRLVLGVTQPTDLETLGAVLSSHLGGDESLKFAAIMLSGTRSDIVIRGKPLFGSNTIKGHPLALLIGER